MTLGFDGKGTSQARQGGACCISQREKLGWEISCVFNLVTGRGQGIGCIILTCKGCSVHLLGLGASAGSISDG